MADLGESNTRHRAITLRIHQCRPPSDLENLARWDDQTYHRSALKFTADQEGTSLVDVLDVSLHHGSVQVNSTASKGATPLP